MRFRVLVAVGAEGDRLIYSDTLTDLAYAHLDWQVESGAHAIRLLLDKADLRPGIDVQAIVAVSDLPALGALKALQARGIQAPRDLAIVGLDPGHRDFAGRARRTE
jgi:DNA-binding LacI/PurR family transcriptional regulator